MKLKINDNEYELKLNLRARIKLSKFFDVETELFAEAAQGDIGKITRIIHTSLQGYDFSYEYFLQSYPELEKSYEAFYRIFQELIIYAGNPFDIPSRVSTSKDENGAVKTDFRGLIIFLMSKGYRQDEILDMTYWDINLILDADYLKLEREVFHTNALINTMAGLMGSKETIDILGRKEKENYRDYSVFEKVSTLLDKYKN